VKHELPKVVQGGMGVGVSGWRLARAVSRTGQLGVVSGTGLDVILARRLQTGDPGGHVRRALGAFPKRGVAERLLDAFFVPGGKAAETPFAAKPVPTVEPSPMAEDLLVAGNFVEVFLAREGQREGHHGLVGVNYLEKIQLPTLPSLYGAMLAGADWVLMGAGIPTSVPGVLDRLAAGQPVELRLNVVGARSGEEFVTRFDPRAYLEGAVPRLHRPSFAAIVSTATLAAVLVKRANGRLDGFVVEGPTAGGHNAPPRGQSPLQDDGQPRYGVRDVADLEAVRALGLPFWLAGSYGTPGRLAEALAAGAAGVQVGTAFAYCEESDLAADVKARVLQASRDGCARVFTDPVASPTGFPFKVVQLSGTLSEAEVYGARDRVCDLGYLRHAYRRDGGSLGWRCPAEPVQSYLRKGGQEADTHGRRCVCNALLSNVGLGNVRRDGGQEPMLVTSGDDVVDVARFLRSTSLSYSAADVVRYLLAGVAGPGVLTAASGLASGV
jgi:nitronate monooxygenase